MFHIKNSAAKLIVMAEGQNNNFAKLTSTRVLSYFHRLYKGFKHIRSHSQIALHTAIYVSIEKHASMIECSRKVVCTMLDCEGYWDVSKNHQNSSLFNLSLSFSIQWLPDWKQPYNVMVGCFYVLPVMFHVQTSDNEYTSTDHVKSCNKIFMHNLGDSVFSTHCKYIEGLCCTSRS